MKPASWGVEPADGSGACFEAPCGARQQAPDLRCCIVTKALLPRTYLTAGLQRCGGLMDGARQQRLGAGLRREAHWTLGVWRMPSTRGSYERRHAMKIICQAVGSRLGVSLHSTYGDLTQQRRPHHPTHPFPGTPTHLAAQAADGQLTKEQLLAIMEAQRTSATKVPIGRGSAAAPAAGGGRGGHHHHHHQGRTGKHTTGFAGLGAGNLGTELRLGGTNSYAVARGAGTLGWHPPGCRVFWSSLLAPGGRRDGRRHANRTVWLGRAMAGLASDQEGGQRVGSYGRPTLQAPTRRCMVQHSALEA